MKEWTGILPLAAQAKLLDDRLVTFQIRLLEVIKELSPTGCHHQQSATGMEILAVRFQVFRKMSDTGGEQGDLHFTRSGILVVGTVFFDYVLFVYLF